MALNATVDPMLMRDKSVVIVKVMRTEFKGIFQPGLTYEVMDMLVQYAEGNSRERLTYPMNEEKGSPLSRAKDQVWRETVATVLIQADVMFTIRIAVMIEVPALLCVTLKNT